MVRNHRLTPKWTQTLGEAFGGKGELGALGEKRVRDILRDIGIETIHNESDRCKQRMGHDLETLQGLGIDVKCNLTSSDFVWVDVAKIHNTKATLWIHVPHDNSDDLVAYKVADMLNIIKNHCPSPINTKNGLCYSISRNLINEHT